MDCKTARMLLNFARPQARELEAEETGALEDHLDHCSDCHSLADHDRLFEDRLGQAMRCVEVPVGLREQLLARLESARGDWYRQRFARLARWSAAAAALLLLTWGGARWLSRHWPVAPLDPQRIAVAVNDATVADKRGRAEDALRRLGVQTPLSPHLDYNWLACPPTLAELPGYPGRQAPMMLFVRNGRMARVYLLPNKAVPVDTDAVFGGGTYKAELLPSEGEPYRFLVIHDGDNLDWLRPPPPQAA